MLLAGFRIGREVVFYGPIHVSGYGPSTNLRLGDGCHVNARVDFDLSGIVEIEGHVGIGQEVLFVTNSHEIGDAHQRGGQTTVRAVSVGEGAWLGARSMILPGVTIGAGAVVAAGSVVTKDVPPHTLVAGTPAVVKRDLGER
jgi:acetyltransferase-like isoleucine patch superfamily enzyme